MPTHDGTDLDYTLRLVALIKAWHIEALRSVAGP
jgi:hypothetical protein